MWTHNEQATHTLTQVTNIEQTAALCFYTHHGELVGFALELGCGQVQRMQDLLAVLNQSNKLRATASKVHLDNLCVRVCVRVCVCV